MSDSSKEAGLEIAMADVDSPKTTGLIAHIGDGMSSLKGSPRELYLAYLLKFLDAYSYFSLSLIFTLFLSEEFGFTDFQAGGLYGAWGGLSWENVCCPQCFRLCYRTKLTVCMLLAFIIHQEHSSRYMVCWRVCSLTTWG